MGSKCYYPDWEGGLIVAKHEWSKDGYCCICGEKKPDEVKQETAKTEEVIDGRDDLAQNNEVL